MIAKTLEKLGYCSISASEFIYDFMCISTNNYQQ